MRKIQPSLELGIYYHEMQLESPPGYKYRPDEKQKVLLYVHDVPKLCSLESAGLSKAKGCRDEPLLSREPHRSFRLHGAFSFQWEHGWPWFACGVPSPESQHGSVIWGLTFR